MRVDLGQWHRAEHRQQLAAQDAAVALAGLVLQRPDLDPALRVGGERRRGRWSVVAQGELVVDAALERLGLLQAGLPKITGT
jgi:hypothetical protein